MMWEVVTTPAQVIGSIDTATKDGDMTCVAWWERQGDGTLKLLDEHTFLPSRTHDDDLLGEFSMSPAGFPYIPGLAAMVLVSQPELDFARSPAEFSDAFGPTARTRIAQERMNARLDRKRIRQARYSRMMARRALN